MRFNFLLIFELTIGVALNLVFLICLKDHLGEAEVCALLSDILLIGAIIELWNIKKQLGLRLFS